MNLDFVKRGATNQEFPLLDLTPCDTNFFTYGERKDVRLVWIERSRREEQLPFVLKPKRFEIVLVVKSTS
jgi:hypothetical protein